MGMTLRDVLFFMFLAFTLGTAFGGIGVQLFNNMKIKQILEPCEKFLPRDQHCKLIAVPILKEQK